MYKSTQKHVLRISLQYVKQAMLADFIKSKPDVEKFNCIFKVEELDDNELKNLIHSYAHADGSYWYQGEKTSFNDLLKTLREKEHEFVNVNMFIQEL